MKISETHHITKDGKVKSNPEKIRHLEKEGDFVQFTGTENYHKWSIIFRNDVLTDGAKALADKYQCYWLMDIIGSYQGNPKMKANEFQTWKVKVDKSNKKSYAVVTCDDGNGNILARQSIPYTDLPDNSEIKLFYTNNVIMLPQEY